MVSERGNDAGSATEELVAGRYLLGEVLGRGGMGEVRAARDVTLGRDVAVKLLHAGLASDERVSRRFEHEARAAGRLTHPNVVRVYDAGEHRGRPFIVMERLDGGTLADEIARGPLSEARVRFVGVQVLEALAAAHKHGVLHRDIKPSNVMIAPDGSVRVADFGIAKSELDTGRTTTGTVVGTLGYLPPERLQGHPATTASDCYAVGVVLYEALSGRRPFDGDSPIAVLTAVQRGAPPSLTALRRDVDPSLPAAIERAMALEPDRRYATALDFAAALRNPGSVAVPDAAQPDATVAMSVDRPPLRPPERPSTPPPFAAATPARPAPSRPGSSGPASRPVASRPAAPPPVRAGRVAVLLLALALLGAAIGAGIGFLLRDDGSSPATSATLTSEPGSGSAVDAALRDLESAVTP
jgi:serine/threonine-protein kinase